MRSESFIYFEMQIRLMKEVMRMGEIKEIKLYTKSWTEDWDSAREEIVHGFELDKKENEKLFDFVEKLLEKTHYASFAITKIYETIEKGFVIKLFKQTENQYGGYVGTIETYVTVEDIVKNIRR
jgi:hypothetical protein